MGQNLPIATNRHDLLNPLKKFFVSMKMIKGSDKDINCMWIAET